METPGKVRRHPGIPGTGSGRGRSKCVHHRGCRRAKRAEKRKERHREAARWKERLPAGCSPRDPPGSLLPQLTQGSRHGVCRGCGSHLRAHPWGSRGSAPAPLGAQVGTERTNHGSGHPQSSPPKTSCLSWQPAGQLSAVPHHVQQQQTPRWHGMARAALSPRPRQHQIVPSPSPPSAPSPSAPMGAGQPPPRRCKGPGAICAGRRKAGLCQLPAHAQL